MRTSFALTAAILLLCVVPARADDKPKDSALALKPYESKHYRLQTDIDADTARQYLVVLETAWPQLKKFFGAEPRLKKNELLNVYYLATREEWQSKMKEDSVAVPSGAGGYYSPGNKTVYLWKQPTVYNCRQLLLHECMHQFHFLSRCNNNSPKDAWYVEGLVENLSRHYWDGEKLTLGVIPFCSLANYPRAALKLMQAKDYDLAGMIDGTRASQRPEQWALTRWLLKEGGDKQWARLTKALNGGQSAHNVFKRIYGDPAKLQPRIVEWLKTQQEPFVPVWNEWQGQGARAAMGWAATSYSMCRTRENVDSIAADVVIHEGDWQGGVIVYFKDTKDYALFMVDQSGAWVVTHGGDKWTTPARGKVEPKAEGSYRLKAERDGGKVKLLIDDVEVGSVDYGQSPMGICLRNSTLHFTDIEWK